MKSATSSYPLISNFTFTNILWRKKKKKTVNMWEYKFGNNANVGNFFVFVKTTTAKPWYLNMTFEMTPEA